MLDPAAMASSVALRALGWAASVMGRVHKLRVREDYDAEFCKPITVQGA